MTFDPKTTLTDCATLMLDMDGTVLDLAYDNYVWKELVPARFAARHGVPIEHAKRDLYARYRAAQGNLEWYCLDHWSERLDLDIIGLHREERERIGWLPGAQAFLEAIGARGLNVLLVTNSHRDTLALKSEVTGIERYFERVHTAHDFGFSKEQRGFWEALAEEQGFDPETTMFVDDTESVLDSAQRYGVRHLVTILRPDTSREPKGDTAFDGIHGVSELLD